MTSKPHDLLHGRSGVADPSTPRRARTPGERNRGVWRFLRRTMRGTKAAARIDPPVAFRTSGALVLSWRQAPAECLTAEWRHADLGEVRALLGLPDVPRTPGGGSRARVPAVATRLSHAGRLISFNFAVAIIHLAFLRWIFLPVGS